MKKILSLLIAGLLLVSLVACSKNEEKETDKTTPASSEQNQNGVFEFEEVGGDLEIVGYSNSSVDPIDLVLPAKHDEKYVIGIADGVFQSSSIIKSLTFEKDSKYEYIGDAAFAGCDILTDVTLPDTLEQIGINTFNGCKALQTVTLSASIKEIPEYAFINCTSLTTIDVSNVTSIKEGAFANCSSLKKLTLSSDLEYASKTAFLGCDALEYTKENGLCYLGNSKNSTLLLVQPEQTLTITECTVNAKTKVIADKAFINCEKLEKITLSDAVKVISGTAFENCPKLSFNESENGLYLGTEENPYKVLVKLTLPSVVEFALNKDTEIITNTAFADSKNLEEISYSASKADWDKILLSSNWNNKLSLSLFCDGVQFLVSLDGSVKPID